MLNRLNCHKLTIYNLVDVKREKSTFSASRMKIKSSKHILLLLTSKTEKSYFMSAL